MGGLRMSSLMVLSVVWTSCISLSLSSFLRLLIPFLTTISWTQGISMPPLWTHTPPGALLLWPDAQQVILISFSSNGLSLCWIKTVVKLFSTSCRRVLQGDLETSSGDRDRGRGLRIDEVWNLVTMFSRFKALMRFISLLGVFFIHFSY